MTKLHGIPCWYELATSPGSLGAAEAFYGDVLGWAVRDAGMEGFDYRLASADGDMVEPGSWSCRRTPARCRRSG
jgi:uncharacterized protein